MFEVIESFARSKTGDPKHGDDVIVITDHFVAVIDGVSGISDETIDGMRSGRFAVELVAESIRSLPPEATMKSAFEFITQHLSARFSEKDAPTLSTTSSSSRNYLLRFTV